MNLDSYRGRILDADAHLQLPLRVYPEMLGPAGETIHKGFAKMLGGSTGEMLVFSVLVPPWTSRQQTAP